MANSVRASAVAPEPLRVDMNRLIQNESNFVADAVGKQGDMGLGQITPIALADYNQANPKQQYQHNTKDMFDPGINTQVSDWLVNTRAPQLLKAYGLEDNLDNRLAVYKAGIGNVVSGKAWTPATKAYINKFKTIKVTGQPQ